MISRPRLIILYFCLCVQAVVFLFPFYWVVSSSVKTRTAMSMMPPPFYPAERATRDFVLNAEDRLFESMGFDWLLLAHGPDLMSPETSEAGPEEGYYMRLEDGVPSQLVEWKSGEDLEPFAGTENVFIAFDVVPVHAIEPEGERVAMVARMARQHEDGTHTELLFCLPEDGDPTEEFAILKDRGHHEIRRWHARWENYPETLRGPDSTFGQKSVGFLTYMRNSFFVSGMAVLGQILSSSLVAFGFARLRFRGRETLFILLLASLMIPYQVTLIPLFNIYKTLGWIDSFLPLIVHHFGAGAFNVFLLRQYMLTLPIALDESAAIDGCGVFRTYFYIILPNCIPVLIVVGLFTFVHTWQDVMGPLIYLDSPELRTVPLGLEYFRSGYVDNRHLMMTGATLAMLPVAILFVIFQRYIMSGIATTGLK